MYDVRCTTYDVRCTMYDFLIVDWGFDPRPPLVLKVADADIRRIVDHRGLIGCIGHKGQGSRFPSDLRYAW